MSQPLHTTVPIAAALAFLASLCIYRLFLHPLAKYPGPFWARLTGFYLFPNVITGDNHIHLQQLHEKYGSVVRVAPNMLSYNTHTALHDVHGDRKANVQKAGFTETHALLNSHRTLQTCNDKTVHAKKRRFISHAFSEEAIRSSEDYVVSCIQLLCSRITPDAAPTYDGWSPTLDMRDWTENLAMDIMGELCFGKAFGAIEAGSSTFAAIMEDYTAYSNIICWIPNDKYLHGMLKLWQRIASKLNFQSAQKQAMFEGVIAKMITERLSAEKPAMKSDNKERRDFFHYLMQAVDPETGEKLGFQDMISECGLLFGAGVDSSATTMAGTLFYLVHYPEQLKRLQAEIRQNFNDVEEIREGEQLRNCKFLAACIDETLRMSPAVPGPMLRKALPGGLTVDGDYVPAGTLLAVPTYALHHNERYHPDPHTWTPERWLAGTYPDGSEDESLQLARHATNAFSAGPRACIGRKLAYLTIKLTLARLLFLFDLRLAPHTHDGEGHPALSPHPARHRPREYQLKDCFVTANHGPRVQLRRR